MQRYRFGQTFSQRSSPYKGCVKRGAICRVKAILHMKMHFAPSISPPGVGGWVKEKLSPLPWLTPSHNAAHCNDSQVCLQNQASNTKGIHALWAKYMKEEKRIMKIMKRNKTVFGIKALENK